MAARPKVERYKFDVVQSRTGSWDEARTRQIEENDGDYDFGLMFRLKPRSRSDAAGTLEGASIIRSRAI
jgi:hypothetical protein